MRQPAGYIQVREIFLFYTKFIGYSIWGFILGKCNKTGIKKYLAGARDLLLLVNANDRLVLPAIGIILIFAGVQVDLIVIKFVISLKLISHSYINCRNVNKNTCIFLRLFAFFPILFSYVF